MITVKVVLPNLPVTQSGGQELLLELANGNIKELINSLKSNYSLIAGELFDSENLNSNYFLAINDEMIPQSEGILSEYILNNNDEITFVFAIAGG